MKKLLWRVFGPLHESLSVQFGLNIILFVRGIGSLPRYFAEYLRVRRDYAGNVRLTPQLHDRRQAAGSLGEYFWQDLTVAQMIREANPPNHVDVGSSIQGFIGHLASFREVEVIDIRALPFAIPNVRFRQLDMMADPPALTEYADSLSCLHTIEHFGLGRYGDNYDLKGPQRGICNLAAMLRPGGVLYLSTPVGQERIEFNANWVFDPRRIVSLCEASGLKLERLLTIRQNEVRVSSNIVADPSAIADENYALGIFVLRKGP